MQWPTIIQGSGKRLAAERAFSHPHGTPPDVHPSYWWNLCSALSCHQLRHGLLRPVSELWSELLPFLLMRPERLGRRALEEYLLYLQDPRLADKQWLGIWINGGLERADSWDEGIGAVLEEPSRAFEAGWLPLLSYQSLLLLRRAVALYDSDEAHARRASFWHGHPFDRHDMLAISAGRTQLAPPFGHPEGPIRRRARATETPAAFRRCLPSVPASLS